MNTMVGDYRVSITISTIGIAISSFLGGMGWEHGAGVYSFVGPLVAASGFVYVLHAGGRWTRDIMTDLKVPPKWREKLGDNVSDAIDADIADPKTWTP